MFGSQRRPGMRGTNSLSMGATATVRTYRSSSTPQCPDGYTYQAPVVKTMAGGIKVATSPGGCKSAAQVAADAAAGSAAAPDQGFSIPPIVYIGAAGVAAFLLYRHFTK